MSSTDSNVKKRSESILGRLLETYLPDEKQKLSKKRTKKSTSNRNTRKVFRERHAIVKETLDPEKAKKKKKEAITRNINTLTSWNSEREIDEIKQKVCILKLFR